MAIEPQQFTTTSLYGAEETRELLKISVYTISVYFFLRFVIQFFVAINRWSAPLCRGDVPPGAAAGGLVKGYGAHLYIFGGMLEYGLYV